MPDPVITEGAPATITWTMDDGLGYALDALNPSGGAFVVENGSLGVKENTPAATLLGNNATQVASGWSVNDNDADGVDGLQTIAGDSIDGISAWDTTADDNASFKMRGNATAGELFASESMRSAGTPSEWQIHQFRFYANSAGTSSARTGWIGTWTNSSTPQLGILWDPGDGILPNHYILASGGVSAWPSFNTEESSGIARSPDAWVYVLWAGRVITVGSTDYYDRVVVMNSTVVKKNLSTTSIFSPPTGGRFGCIMEGDYNAEPAFFDSYKVWQGLRYPTTTVVQLPDARPSSIGSVTAYTVSSVTTGVDRGGAVQVKYRLSSDGGSSFGPYVDIANITSEIFAGKGDDVIRIVVGLSTSTTIPATGVHGLFAPLVNQVQLEYAPVWREQGQDAATWTEATV